MSDINIINMIGRLTADPELTYTQAGTALCKFTIANNQTYTKNGEKTEQVNFFNCVAWSKLAEVITEYCVKGQRVAIQGKLQQRKWEDDEGKTRSYIDIAIQNFQFLERPKGSENGKPEDKKPVHAGSSKTYPEPMENNPFEDDTIPF